MPIPNPSRSTAGSCWVGDVARLRVDARSRVQDRQFVDRTAPAWFDRRVVYPPEVLGMNYAIMHPHRSSVDDGAHWLTTPYDPAKVEADLDILASLGIRILRIFAAIETVLEYSSGAFGESNVYAGNLDDFLTRCGRFGITVIPVMGDGTYEGAPKPPFDGKFLWELIETEAGRRAYARAYVAYVDRFARHDNILYWEIANEPYGNLTWSPRPKELGITQDLVHAYLVEVYETLKDVTGLEVGFSEIQEQEQEKYRTFSDDNVRTMYVDDCTDYYSMHVYRGSASQLPDFRSLNGKPKYLTEVGSYNYIDPTGEGHGGLPADNEYLKERPNMQAVIDISRKALNSGFAQVLPWDMAYNTGMFEHHPDGTHTVKALPIWMRNVLAASQLEDAP